MFHTIKQQFSNLLNNIFIQPKNKFLNYEKNSCQEKWYVIVCETKKKAKKETPIFRPRQEHGVTDWERCPKEEIAGTLWSW